MEILKLVLILKKKNVNSDKGKTSSLSHLSSELFFGLNVPTSTGVSAMASPEGFHLTEWYELPW